MEQRPNPEQQPTSEPVRPAPAQQVNSQTAPFPEQSSNKGLKIALISLVALVLIAAGVVAWFFMKPKDAAAPTTQPSNGQNIQTKPDTTQPSSTDQTDNKVYMTISELGVKYVKTDNQKHLSYTYEKLDNNGGAMIDFLTDIAGSKCPAKHSAGYIERSAAQMKGLDGTVYADQKQIGMYWYRYVSPQSLMCDAAYDDEALGVSIENESKIVQNEIFATLVTQ